MSDDKQSLRQKLRRIRANISPAEQARAASELNHNLCHLNIFSSSTNIATYWPDDNEINTQIIIKSICKVNKLCFLPVLLLDSRQQLGFASYTPSTSMIKNRYGILEPDMNTAFMCDLSDLDIILTPLLAFDSKGYRLGRGGGFYDATFSHLSLIPKYRRPKLIGLAYECQKVDRLPIDSWDYKLDLVTTESQIYTF